MSIKSLIRTSLSAVILTAGVTAFVAPAIADPLDDAIKARRAYFQLVVHNFGPLAGMAKGKVEYDAERAKVASSNLAAIAALNIQTLFPAGSDNEAKKGATRATAKIWSDFDGVAKILGDFQSATANLASVAGNGKDGLGAAVGEVGKQCGACHKAYRAENF